MPPLTAVIVAGGRSARLGSAKPLIRIGGRLVLARQAAALAPICDETILVVRQGQDDDVADTAIALRMRVVEDNYPGAGPLAGIEAGVAAAATDLVFVTGADHPFLSRSLIQAMAEAASGSDIVVPEVGDRLQPLHAVYRRSIRAEIKAALEARRLSPTDLIKECLRAGNAQIFPERDALEYDPRLSSFVDIDTPGDLARARVMLRRADIVRPDIRPGGV